MKLHLSIIGLVTALVAGGFYYWRTTQDVEDVRELKIGIVAPLSGPGALWGEVTLNAARVTADYYNEKGGFEVNGQRYHIKLLVNDDRLDPIDAVDAVRHLIYDEGVKYLLGPLGDDAIVAVANILDVSNVVYIHYGFLPELLKEGSSGILGMPIPIQTLPFIFKYLQDAKQVKTVSVIAANTRQAIQQKIIAENLAEEAGLQVINYSSYDLLEETFDFAWESDGITEPILNVIQSQPDAVILTGLPPENLTRAVEAFRQAGYNMPLVAQNSQDQNLLMQIGEAAEGVIYIGGDLPEVQRSHYFQDLKSRYLALTNNWNGESVTKLYALESLLRFIRHIGAPESVDSINLNQAMETFEYEDPFFLGAHTVRLVGRKDFSVQRQLSTPVVVSEIAGGVAKTVGVFELPE